MRASGKSGHVAIVALLALVGGTTSPAHAASILQSRAADLQGCARSEVMRDDAELESRAARIGVIEFAIGEVFDPHGADPDAVLYRVANRLHAATDESTLRAQLLFGPGELYRRRVLEETERSLRRLRFLYDAQIEPVRYDAAANEVDVRVCTRDVWTLSPGVSFGRSGGANSFGFELEDYNVLGSGQRLTLQRKHNVDRTTTALSWHAPNLGGTRWQTSADYQHNSDGGLRAFGVTRPFYSLEAERAFGAQFADAALHQRLYRLGEPVFVFAAAERDAELWFGRSPGLENGWVRRFRAGWTFEDRRFAALADGPRMDPLADPQDLPPDRRLSYGWIALQWIEDRFTKTHDLDQIGRTEDMNLGFVGEARIGFATPAIGSDRAALLLSGQASWSESWQPQQLLSLDAALHTRLESGQAVNTDATLAARNYWRWSDRWMTFGSIEGRWTHLLDPEQQVLLGGDNGLRGFPLRFLDGEAAALATIEHRLFTPWKPFNLVHVGAAVFADAGRTWRGADTGWLADAGIGLRLGNSRSSRGNVIHIDFAIPFGVAGEPQLLIQTKTSF